MAVDYALTGHAAIVTGSTSGIGQALANALCGQGVNMVLNGLGEAVGDAEADAAGRAGDDGNLSLQHDVLLQVRMNEFRQ